MQTFSTKGKDISEEIERAWISDDGEALEALAIKYYIEAKEASAIVNDKTIFNLIMIAADTIHKQHLARVIAGVMLQIDDEPEQVN